MDFEELVAMPDGDVFDFLKREFEDRANGLNYVAPRNLNPGELLITNSSYNEGILIKQYDDKTSENPGELSEEEVKKMRLLGKTVGMRHYFPGTDYIGFHWERDNKGTDRVSRVSRIPLADIKYI